MHRGIAKKKIKMGDDAEKRDEYVWVGGRLSPLQCAGAVDGSKEAVGEDSLLWVIISTTV